MKCERHQWIRDDAPCVDCVNESRTVREAEHIVGRLVEGLYSNAEFVRGISVGLHAIYQALADALTVKTGQQVFAHQVALGSAIGQYLACVGDEALVREAFETQLRLVVAEREKMRVAVRERLEVVR